MRIIQPQDDEWRQGLDELGPYPPPERLFAQGISMAGLKTAVALVGTRRPTGAGVQAARDLARGLAEAGFIVVSGMAVGIDTVAHRAALEAGGHTVAVLGCGLDIDYPQSNLKLKERIAEHGTLVTEYSEGTPPARFNFPWRNRIIAGLSAGVVVVEGGTSSGALITARIALDANRTVYALPGSIRNPMSEGPNDLIRTSRAALVTCVEHIFEDLAPGLVYGDPQDVHTSAVSAVDATELRVLRALDDVPLSPDGLAPALAIKPGRLAATLAQLEVKGLVERSTAGYALSSAGSRTLSLHK